MIYQRKKTGWPSQGRKGGISLLQTTLRTKYIKKGLVYTLRYGYCMLFSIYGHFTVHFAVSYSFRVLISNSPDCSFLSVILSVAGRLILPASLHIIVVVLFVCHSVCCMTINLVQPCITLSFFLCA